MLATAKILFSKESTEGVEAGQTVAIIEKDADMALEDRKVS